jgi:hypothetical protein
MKNGIVYHSPMYQRGCEILNDAGYDSQKGFAQFQLKRLNVGEVVLTVLCVARAQTSTVQIQTFESCLVKWRAGQDESANTYVIEVAL